MNFVRLVSHPLDYLRALKLNLGGWYFDIFMKKFQSGGSSFTVPKALTTRMGRGYFALGLYEQAERKLVSKYVKGSESVLELGACIGVVSCIVNARLADPARHVVVEANAELIPWLEQNKKDNNCKFYIENCVVSRQPQEFFFFGHSIVSGSLLNVEETGKKTAVKGKTIEQIQQERNIIFNALIMDIEGGEYEVITQNPAFLKQLDLVIIENHPHILAPEKIAAYEDMFLSSGLRTVEEIDTTKVWCRH